MNLLEKFEKDKEHELLKNYLQVKQNLEESWRD